MGEDEGGGGSVPLTDKLSQGWVGLEDVRLDEVLERGSLLLSRGMQVRGRHLAFGLALPGETGYQLRPAAVEALRQGMMTLWGLQRSWSNVYTGVEVVTIWKIQIRLVAHWVQGCRTIIRPLPERSRDDFATTNVRDVSVEVLEGSDGLPCLSQSSSG